MKPLSKLHTEAIEKAKTDQAKVKAAALAMIETPMGLIKAVLLKHEEAVIEVMRELHQRQQADEALLRQALDALENHTAIKHPQQIHYRDSAIDALRERLT
jgi:hypothetical protein